MTVKLVSFERLESILDGSGQETGSTNRRDLAAAKAVLRAALERELTDRQKECVRLYFFQGLTEEEAGRLLGVSKSTVCRHLQKAKKRLKRAVSYGGAACRALPRED